MILGLLLLFCGGILFASEADELRKRATSMRKEASVLAERGNKEQAERLEKEAVALLEAAEQLELKAKGRGEKGDRPDIEKEVRQLKERLHDLLAKERKLKEAKAPEKALAEVREQIAGTERELHKIQAHHAGRGELPPEFREQAEKLEAATRRIHHLRVAAQNLKMAEAHDLAHEIMKKAESMERDVQEGKNRLAAAIEKAHGGEHGPDVVRELRAEIERLRAEVKELRQKVEKR
jgi:DNA repair exonuclease SbcCD ATPase subunit